MSVFLSKILGPWLPYLLLINSFIMAGAVFLPLTMRALLLTIEVFLMSAVTLVWYIAQQYWVEVIIHPKSLASAKIERSQILAARADLAQVEIVLQQAGYAMKIKQVTDLGAAGLSFVCDECEDVLGLLQAGGRLITDTLNWPGPVKLKAFANQDRVICWLLADVSRRAGLVVSRDALRAAFESLEVGLLVSDPWLKREGLLEIIDTLTWWTAPLTDAELEAVHGWAGSEQGTIEVSLDDSGKNRLAFDIRSPSGGVEYRLRWLAIENRLLEKLMQDRVQRWQVVPRPSAWSLAFRRRRARARQMDRLVQMFTELPTDDQNRLIASIQEQEGN